MSEYVSKYGKDVRVDALAGDDSPDRKFPEIDYSPAILEDHDKYFSVDYRDREWKNLWTRTWNIAGRESDLQNVGDFFTFELGRESFIVTRDAPGSVKAYYNVCHHRGTRIVSQALGNASSFVCPFHSWAWNLDGSLRRITDRETFDESLVCDNPPLTEVRCEIWQGFIFINMNPGAESLTDYLGELHGVLENYHMEEMSIVNDLETDWPVNWKTVLDAFMEGYHAHKRHPELLRYIDDYHFQHDLFANGHSRMIIPMALKSPRFSDGESLTAEMRVLAEEFGLDHASFEGRASAMREAFPAAKRAWASRFGLDFSHFTDSQITDDWNVHIFPNITLNMHPEGVLVMRFRPHPADPERCFYDVWVLARQIDSSRYQLPSYMPVADEKYLKPGTGRPPRGFGKHGETSFGMVLDQDAETVPLVQQGVKSRAFKGVRLSHQEIRLRHFYQQYNEYLGNQL